MVTFPIVHILMPVYNAKAFILESIKSVLDQNYPNLKLLIFNDGSTDGTSEVVRSYVVQNPSLKSKIVLKEGEGNQGVAKARQHLIQWSKELEQGAYLFWLDADDQYIDNKFVSDVIVKMQKTNADICLFNFSIIYEDENQKLNATGLLNDRERSMKVLHTITTSPQQSVSPRELPNLLEFTSLGWTKCYAPTVKLPTPANCPFEDFVYMATLLQAKTITALPPERTPIQYLRRSTSICGQRTSKNFEQDIPSQLKMFFETVLKQINGKGKQLKKITMAQNFVVLKFEQYTLTLNRLIEAKSFPTINQTTLNNFLKQVEAIKKLMGEAIIQQKSKSSKPDPEWSKTAVKCALATVAAAGLFFIGYRIFTKKSAQDSGLCSAAKPSTSLPHF